MAPIKVLAFLRIILPNVLVESYLDLFKFILEYLEIVNWLHDSELNGPCGISHVMDDHIHE